MMKRVMIFGAHPDDDLIGCGGSMAKHVKLGNELSACYLTSGESGSLDYSKDELLKIREKEARNAARVIGFQDLTFLRNKDGFLQYDEVNLKMLTELVRKKRPNLVYVHHPSDAHQDHKVTSQLVTEAVLRAGAPFFQEYQGKLWSVDTVLFYEFWTPLAEWNYVEDISEFMDKKVEALKEHKSQIKLPRYDEAVEGLARYRGI